MEKTYGPNSKPGDEGLPYSDPSGVLGEKADGDPKPGLGEGQGVAPGKK